MLILPISISPPQQKRQAGSKDKGSYTHWFLVIVMRVKISARYNNIVNLSSAIRMGVEDRVKECNATRTNSRMTEWFA